MVKKYVILLLVLLFGRALLSQNAVKLPDTNPFEHKPFALNKNIDSLQTFLKKAAPDSNRVNSTNKLSREYINVGLYDTAAKYGNAALQLAQQLNFRKGIAEAYNNIGIANASQGNYRDALRLFFESLKILQTINYKPGLASTYNSIGNIYNFQNNYPEALKNHFLSLKISEEIKDNRAIANSQNNIGVIYYQQCDFARALNYFFPSLKIRESMDDKLGLGTSYNNIGLVYFNQKNYPEALKNYLLSLKIRQDINDKRGVADLYHNVGIIYKYQKNYEEALKNYLAALEIRTEIKDKNGLANTYTALGELYVYLNKPVVSADYFAKGLDLAKEIRSNEIVAKVYMNMVLLDKLQGNWKDAYTHHELFTLYKDSVDSDETRNKLTKVTLNYEFEKKEAAIKADRDRKDLIMEETAKKKKIISISIITVLLLLVAIIVLILRQQRIKHRRDKLMFETNQAIAEKENALLKSEKLRMEEELINAKKLLDNFTESMLQKSEMLEQFETEIKNLKVHEEKIENLDLLNKVTILTDDDWEKFKELFQQVYKGFFSRLKEKLSDLSPAEIRLVCLTKLKLSPKQMASVLGISAYTIRTTRYRLRKKLNLPEEESIDDIVDSI